MNCNKMMLFSFPIIISVLLGISACAPAPTQYVSTLDPCAPTILTAIALDGGIPRCDKLPTKLPPVRISIDSERERKVVDSFSKVRTSSEYILLDKYINDIEVAVVDDALSFNVSINSSNKDEEISLAGELIALGTFVSRAGGPGDWNLGIVEVIFLDNSGKCTIDYFVHNIDDLARISLAEVLAIDVMEQYICE